MNACDDKVIAYVVLFEVMYNKPRKGGSGLDEMDQLASRKRSPQRKECDEMRRGQGTV